MTLFDFLEDQQSVRRTDPPTSAKALRELPLRPRQQEVVDALRHLVVTSTADDVKRVLAERGLHRERNEVASRLSELAGMIPQRVRKVGVRRNHRNKSVATWRLVP